jgi:ribosome maturation factor RimP
MSDPLHSRKLVAALRALAEPIAERQGCELVAIELLGAQGVGRHRVLRVSVDKPGGATIEDCTRISRALSPALDAEDIISSSYDLEVSTPGMDRPLQREQDFERFVGCDIRLKRYGQDSRRKTKAKLVACKDGILTVEMPEGGRTDIPLDDVERANLVLDFEQYARLGQGLHPIAEGEPE